MRWKRGVEAESDILWKGFIMTEFLCASAWTG
jgi:hypothetical protein